VGDLRNGREDGLPCPKPSHGATDLKLGCYAKGRSQGLCKKNGPRAPTAYRKQYRGHDYPFSAHDPCLKLGSLEVVVQKPIPTQIRQLIHSIRNREACDDGFVGELTSAKRL